MTKVTEHTRSGSDAHCCVCTVPIVAGDRYRRMVAVQEDWAPEPFMLALAHDVCADQAGWRSTADVKREAKARAIGDAAAVADFNARAPVGTPVNVWLGALGGKGRPAETLQPAAIFGGSPAVRVRLETGKTDYVVLSHVEVVP